MAFLKQFYWILGILLLAVITTVMLGTPETFFGKQTSFIYSNLSNPAGNRTYVRTNVDFGDEEHLRQFPQEIGSWTQRKEYDVEPWKSQLGAEVAIMRGYTKPGTREIWFLAMQSKSRSSFHPPEVCYPAMGWEIVEEGFVDIPGEDADWIEKPLYPRFSKEETTVRLKKMLVTKKNERRLVLYFYVKHGTLGSASDVVTMVRISAIAPSQGSYEKTLEAEQDLLLAFIPYMFDPGEREDMIIVRLVKMGAGGILIILISFMVPLGIIFYPQIGKLRRLRLSRSQE